MQALEVNRPTVCLTAVLVGFSGVFTTPSSARAVSMPQSGGSDESRMFRGTPSHHGVSATTGLESLGGVAWTFETNGPVRSTPALVDGVLYFGGTDGHFYAVVARDGSVRWNRSIGVPISSSPAVAGDFVIFGDRNNTFHALHRADGRSIWTLETGPDLPLAWGWEGWDYIAASPVIIEADDSNQVAIFGSGNGSVYAVDASTGAIQWQYETSRRIRSTPAVRDGIVYVGGGDGVVYALDAVTGSLRWRFETTGTTLNAAEYGFDRTQIQASPAVYDGRVFIGSRDASMYAIDATTGAMLWHREDGSAWVVSSAVAADGLVLNGRSSSGNFRRLDPTTGEEQWVLSTGGAVFSSPVLVGDVAYFGNGAGWVHAVDVSDGSVRWRFRAGRGIYASPIVADGRLFIGSDDGHLYALQRGEGLSPRLAVFWDDSLQQRSTWGGSDQHRLATEYFERYGYERLDEQSLIRFVTERIEDGAPSVIVFGMDAMPHGLADGPPDSTLLRRYLSHGGKIVWLQFPPLLLTRNESGQVTGVDRDRPGRLLGIDFSRWDSDLYGATPTETGREWGIRNWSVASPSAATDAVDIVLAADELGRATAWVQRYGGPPGTGFVLMPSSTYPNRLDEIRRVAELGVMREMRRPIR